MTNRTFPLPLMSWPEAQAFTQLRYPDTFNGTLAARSANIAGRSRWKKHWPYFRPEKQYPKSFSGVAFMTKATSSAYSNSKQAYSPFPFKRACAKSILFLAFVSVNFVKNIYHETSAPSFIRCHCLPIGQRPGF